MKHSPGPWEIRYSAGKRPYAIEAPNDSAPGGVGSVIRWRGIGFPTSPTALANAHLIAAAPDMLAALKAVVHAYEHGSMIDSFINAIKVIAKAEGRDQ